MKPIATSPTVFVRLRESTVALLLMQRRNEDETLDTIVERLARAPWPARERKPPLSPVDASPAGPRVRQCATGTYALAFLGETLRADTLGALFAELVDSLVEIDPKSVERLAAMRSRRRAYVAREKAVIHPGRPDLRTRGTRSGWWVSANIATVDLDRALRAACEASGLVHGRDIRFLGASGLPGISV